MRVDEPDVAGLLRQSDTEERMRSVVDHVVDGIITIDESGTVESFNPAAERIFGYPATEVVGRNVKLLMPEPYYGEHDGYLANYLRTGMARIIGIGREVVGRRRDGSTFPMDLAVSAFHLGSRRRFTGIVRDITDRKRAEDALRESESHFRGAFEDTNVAMALTDLDDRFVRVNDAFAALFGYSRDELLTLTMADVTHPDHLGDSYANREDLLAGRVNLFEMEKRYRRKDGRVLWGLINVSLVRTPNGQPLHYVGQVQDITERKRVEAALREKDAQLRAADRRLAKLVRGMSEACFILDAEWRFVFVNDRCEPLLHHTREQMLGRAIWEVFGKLVGTPMERHYRRVMDERVPLSFVAFSPIAERWLEVRVFPAGEGVAAFLLDIHDRKEAEESLRASQAQLNSALAAGAIGTWTWDIANDRLTADEFTAHVFSIDTDAAARGLPAAAYLRAVLEEDQPEVAAALARAIASCGPYDIEYRVPLRNGDLRWIQAKGRVEGDAAGHAVTFHGAVIDITARKRTEGRFRRLVESNAQGVLFWNASGEITGANDAFLRIVGYTRDDLAAGRVGWAAMTPPEYVQLDRHALEEMATHGVCTPFEKEYVRKDGSRVPLLMGAATFEDSPQEGVCFVIDITERKQAEKRAHALNAELEERVRERTAELEAANKELEAFSYSVSHDLRAPLRAIDGFSRIVEDDYGSHLPPEVREYLRDVRVNTRQMGQLVDDLLAFSRLGRKPVSLKPVATAALVRGCLDELRPSWAGRQVDVRVGVLPNCYADGVLLKQVWVNLLANALKYTGKRAAAIIEVGGSDSPDGPTYFVRDNGVGFDMRYSHKLFGVFQRLHRVEEYEGTGVGLAIVQRIVHRHGGRIWAEAEPNRGATFFFTLSLSDCAILPKGGKMDVSHTDFPTGAGSEK